MIKRMEKTIQRDQAAPSPAVVHAAEPVAAPAVPASPPPGAWSVSIGKWIHRNKDITANPVGYTGYQYLRSVAAGIPYGISMPLTYYGMLKLTHAGEAIEKAGNAAGSVWKSGIGRNLAQFASSGPVRASAMIASSFTLYRGTSKLAAWTKQQLFDPNDTEDQTIAKVQYYWTDLGNKIREVYPAEVNSTPLAAIVLGYITSSFNIGTVPDELKWNKPSNIQAAVNGGTRLQFMKDVILNPKARFINQAAINTIAYSLFFELGDRLFKDVQVRRRLWQGEPSNISPKAGLSDAAVSLEDDEQAEKDRIRQKFSDHFDHHGAVHRPEESNKTFGFFTNEPGIGRFMFRRVLPTSVGISAYTALKMRHSYMWLGGPFPEITKAAHIPKNIWREGAAVTLFFLIPLVADPWARAYDNFFETLENWAKGKKPNDAPPTPEDKTIIDNNEKLLSRLNEKERGASR
jgi:hypothetical protein